MTHRDLIESYCNVNSTKDLAYHSSDEENTTVQQSEIDDQ